VFYGDGTFNGPDTITVGAATLHFMRAVVATGARAADPGLPGLAEGQYFTNETIFNLTSLPRRLLILGAGPIGCQLAQVFARCGSEGHVVNRSPRVLAREELAAAAIVRERLTRDGVRFHLGVKLLDGGKEHLRFELDGQQVRLDGDAVLVATG